MSAILTQDLSRIISVAARCQVCRLAFAVGGEPYLVPMSFGFEVADGRLALYFHCGQTGRKRAMLNHCPKVCFEMDTDARVVFGSRDCKTNMAYQSVVGFGSAVLLHDPAEKRKALGLIMAQYGKDGANDFPDAAVERTTVFRVLAEQATAKISGEQGL